MGAFLDAYIYDNQRSFAPQRERVRSEDAPAPKPEPKYPYLPVTVKKPLVFRVASNAGVGGDSGRKQCLNALRGVGDAYDWYGYIGGGTYGSVFAGVRRADGALVAGKVMQPCAPGAIVDALRELRATLCVHHPHVVRPDMVHILADGCFVIILPLYATTLRHVLESGTMTVPQVEYAFAAVATAVAATHAAGFAHRDLKPDNVLVGGKGVEVVVADWGMARDGLDVCGGALTPDVVSTWYAAPEVLGDDNTAYSTAVDVWALGIMLLELLMGDIPYTLDSDRPQFLAHVVVQTLGCDAEDAPAVGDMCGIVDVDVVEDRVAHLRRLVNRPGVPDDMYALLNGMLRLDPAARLTAADVVASPCVARGLGRPCAPAAPASAVPRVTPLHGYNAAFPTQILQTFVPGTLAVLPVAPGFAPVLGFTAQMLVPAWVAVRRVLGAQDAHVHWLMAAAASHALPRRAAEWPLTPQQLVGVLVLLSVQTLEGVGSVRSVARRLRGALLGDAADFLLPAQAMVLAGLRGGIGPTLPWLADLRSPHAHEAAAFAACLTSRRLTDEAITLRRYIALANGGGFSARHWLAGTNYTFQCSSPA
jgi:hypothetical protein